MGDILSFKVKAELVVSGPLGKMYPRLIICAHLPQEARSQQLWV